ncbi:hypothetical protein G9H64_03570 [Aquirufa nivalisilvae]|uniref:hypothetical protein n=1 Tax=Aquirufa nivalisilvae TaxID=2516557 RepID=UPI0022A96E7E|nr:hypothetical protein [Aquirufa nivalisilvae]MCZ2481144.1 hypothetical protein [Aquirufa nivalisilvae]MCZ2482027.1 hypothetical protein [Aquirufa nivalisilvae]
MLKKHVVLIGIILSSILLLIATQYYPGGSMSNKNSIGFDWTKNFISNLFAENAINGNENPARYWAYFGMIFLSLSLTAFFVQFSTKISHKGSRLIVRNLGSLGMMFTFLIVTSYHDLMVILSSTLFLVCLFYITVFIFKTKQHFLKLLCVICLLIFYTTLYLYGAGAFDILPVMQKLTFVSVISLVLTLQYRCTL